MRANRMFRTSALAATAAAALALGPVCAADAATGTAATQAPVLPGDLGVHLQNIPGGSAAYGSVLKNAVQLALANQSAAGSFEVQGKTTDLGDNSLGVSSLVALYHAQTGDASVVAAFQKSVDWYLENRVYTQDNPGDPWIKTANSGQPYAAYEPYTLAAGGTGDWPTTVWALLDVGDVLQYGDGLLRPDQQSALISLGLGYWNWLTQVSEFNPQDADNQGIAAVDGALGLAAQLKRLGQPAAAQQLSQQAMTVFDTLVQPLRETDRGYTFFPEHSAGFDQNYGGITISDLWRAWKLTGNRVFYEDGLQMAQYMDMRLGARGFDYGGPRHNEDHPGFEALYGLQHYSTIVGDDLGRYLGTASIPYYHVGTESTNHVVVPDGHFAFATLWQMTDPGTWDTTPKPTDTTYKLRAGSGSLVLGADQLPYLISAGNADVIQAAANGRQGIGLAYTDGSGTHLMQPAPGTTPISVGVPTPGVETRVVTQQLVGPGGTAVRAVTTYTVTDGKVKITTAVAASAFAGVSVGYVTGLPYLTDAANPTGFDTPQQKILGVTGLGGTSLSFGLDGGTLQDPAGVTAGPLAITSPTGIQVANPATAATDDFNDSATLGKTLEQYSTALDSGDPDAGWAQTQQTNLLTAPAKKIGPLLVTDVTYGPANQT
jgi:hypothetical protein